MYRCGPEGGGDGTVDAVYAAVARDSKRPSRVDGEAVDVTDGHAARDPKEATSRQSVHEMVSDASFPESV